MTEILFLILLTLPATIPLFFLLLWIRKRRKKGQNLGVLEEIKYSSLVNPFTFKDNWLTCAVFTVLVIIYLCEVVFAVEPLGPFLSPSLATLFMFGAVSGGTVMEGGEWYRIFTAPFLHASVVHLLFNGIALFFAGRILEKQLGRAWYLAIYFSGGIGGSLLSIAINDYKVLSVGASGAIMGLFAAVLAVSFHAKNKEMRHGLQGFSWRVLIPALLPQAANIDYAGHFGGMIGGGLCALIMLSNWPAESLLPRFRRFAVTNTSIGIAVTVLSFLMVANLDQSTSIMKMMRTAAEHGEKEAQFNFGIMYANGKGVVQDYVEAEKWFRKAAEQGLVEAQFALGVIYSNGNGVLKDSAEAVKWWRKAAEQGKAEAQYNLGLSYSRGEGLPEDYVQAYMWVTLAAAQNQEMVETRTTLEGLLSPKQIAEGKRLASEWRPKKLK